MSKALLFVFVALVLLASACGPKRGDILTVEPTSAPATTEPTQAPATEAPAATEAAVVPGKVDAAADVASQGMTAKLSTLESEVLGSVLVDTNGKVVYVFKGDGQNSGKSACSGECLWTWAPLTTTNAPAGADGLDASLLGTINRTTSGVVQVTYNGWPLYRYLPDSSIPGQINGQGVDGKWFAIAPDGSLVTVIPTPVAP